MSCVNKRRLRCLWGKSICISINRRGRSASVASSHTIFVLLNLFYTMPFVKDVYLIHDSNTAWRIHTACIDWTHRLTCSDGTPHRPHQTPRQSRSSPSPLPWWFTHLHSQHCLHHANPGCTIFITVRSHSEFASFTSWSRGRTSSCRVARKRLISVAVSK